MLRIATFCALAQLFANASPSCQPTVEGSLFDLTLVEGKGKDYQGSDAEYNYHMNICGSAVIGGLCTSSGGAICQYYKSDSRFVAVIGSWTAAPEPVYSLIETGSPEKGMKITYVNGKSCFINNQNVVRTAVVNLHCGENEATPGGSFTVSEDPTTCVFTINMDASQICSGSGGLSGGSIFIIILVVCLSLYTAIGCALGFKNGLRGKEAFPHLPFWVGLPALVRDGCKFVMQKATGKAGTDSYDEL